jgi:catechol 2,3-dioxygenase-like lactoylglutathione lyase family enzyme
MATELNHMIIPAKDKPASAHFLAQILGLSVAPEWGPFVPIRTSNGVVLDFAEETEVRAMHCAFLVGDAEFDAALARLEALGVTFYADFNKAGRGMVNCLYGGRGVYFDDPNGHLFELITKPYGATPERWIEGKS